MQRRLVEQHRDAGLVDWAESALRGAGIDGKSDPEAALIASRVDVALGNDALRLRAMQRLKAAAGPADAPSAILEVLLPLTSEYAPALGAAVAELLVERGDADAETVCRWPPRKEAVTNALPGAPSRVESTRPTTRSGSRPLWRWPERTTRLGLSTSSSRGGLPTAAPYGQVSRAGAIEVDAARGSAMFAALQQARELDPGEVRYRAELALRALAPGRPAGQRGQALARPETILAGQGSVGDALPDPSRAPDVAPDHQPAAAVISAPIAASPGARALLPRRIVIAPQTEDELYEEVPAEGISPRSRPRAGPPRGRRNGVSGREASDDGRLRIK